MPLPPIAFHKGSLEYRLAQFDAKERFALINAVLGVEFVPHKDFVARIFKVCGIETQPERIFCAMDFHLDWLYAALMKPDLDPAWLKEDVPLPRIFDEEAGEYPVTGKQQDADFVMCFTESMTDKPASPPVTHLLLIEAKGVGSWNTKQMRSKLMQYRAMKHAFDAPHNLHVRPHLVLMSPKDPFEKSAKNAEFLDVLNTFKQFGDIRWLDLQMRETLCVVRCNDKGKPDGKHPTQWLVKPRRAVDPDHAA
ncbi:hypothetical protein QCE62_24495 [Caballeronia sp. LZ033]|uniref:hypothetical protein n=1 Tax=Caballeronia sp. LZ033 TaxID=3038566 RepID=UPI0028668A4F|nr:hypothetical protein [Caballeronia sp. LZ033]MDR5816760.1 hypothetical protein [Caballeronia sp. LZ033]